MTATAITLPPTPSIEARTTEPRPTDPGMGVRPVWKTGVAAGLAASVATTATAGVAHAAGVSLAVGGQAIPLARASRR